TALGMLQRQIRDNPTPLHVHRPSLPAWCDQIVQRALAKTPADRFQSAEEFRDALSRATGPLSVADFARTFAVVDGQHTHPVPGPTDTIDLSRQAVVNGPKTVQNATAPPTPSGVNRNVRSVALVAAAVIIGVAIGYAALQLSTTPHDESGREMAKAAVPAEPLEPVATPVSAPVE